MHRNILSFTVFISSFIFTPAAYAHEMWLLSVNEVITLNALSIPTAFMFNNPISLLVMTIMSLLFLVAYYGEIYFKDIENQYADKIMPLVTHYIPVIMRLSLGLVLLYAAFGILPRHGNSTGTPTLFVPDLMLKILGNWGQIFSYAQIIIAAMLLLGVYVRIAASGIIMLVVMGAAAFGADMMVSYAAHFMMPALFLLCVGAGQILKLPDNIILKFSSKINLKMQKISDFFASCDMDIIYRTILFGTGFNFMFLGVYFKFMQPNLIIGILSSGAFPLFGLPVEYVALIMACIEVFAGLCLMMGILVRPISALLLCAMTLFSVILGENPIMHGNLYGLMILCFVYGSVKYDTDDVFDLKNRVLNHRVLKPRHHHFA
jgi:uncharacterized membrane protein YphA (DoxX/SURF4 family)